MQKWIGRTAPDLYDLKEKQKAIGKLGTSCTMIDMKTCFGKMYTYNDGNKIEARDSFVSVRANNCLVKGKWCYEVLLESNGLLQIGFCQLKTVFNSQYGVGDDIHSFGYDGYRISCWNKDGIKYGKIWDYGDIIGVCIDLDNKQLEFYQNGEKLGIIKKNVENGPGVAYFPAISFSDYEKCYFNFGACPLTYSYSGYEPMDIPKSQYNGSFEVTSLLLQCLNHSNLLDFLDNDFIDPYIQKLVNQKIFYFLINISFKDLFLCKCLLFPFMYSLMKKNKIQLQIFLEQITKNVNINDNKTFFNGFFEKLTNIIEEYAFMGPKFYEKYQLYSELFIEIIGDIKYFNKWCNTQNFFGHLRNIFNSNNFHFGSVFDKITEFYGDEQYSQTMGNLLIKLTKDGNLVNQEMNEYDNKYMNMIKKIMEKIFDYYDKKTTLCQGTFIFYDLMRACYPINTIKEYIYDLNTFMGSDNKKNILAFKNIIISYMSFFFEKYKNINLDEFPIGSATIIQIPTINTPIKNELSKTGIYVSYFKEENIGGKSANLLGKYKTPNIFKGINKKSSIYFNILVKLISLLDKFFFAYYELHSLSKDYIFANYIPSDRGTVLVNALFRFYFYLFNDNCQIILYSISFFLIKWLHNIKNKLDFALLPLYLIDFPFQIAQLMLISKSKILFDDEYRTKINDKCPLFKNDDFLESLYTLFITLFIKRELCVYSALTQSLGWKIFFFLREKKSREIIIKNEKFINNIMKGIANIITHSNAERIILRILTIIQRTTRENLKEFSFEEILEEENNRNKIKTILNTDEYKVIFFEIAHNFCKNLNSKLIIYNEDLDNCKRYCIDSNFAGNDISRYNNNLKSSLKGVISLINFYEFMLNISQESFLNTETLDLPLVYVRNFFVTLTTKILEKPFFDYLEKILNYIYIKDSILIDLLNAVVNLLLICKKPDNGLFIDFLVSTRNILIKPLLNVYNVGIEIINSKIENENCPFYQDMRNKYEEYKELINELDAKKKIYEEEYLKKLKDIEYLDDEYLCVICLRNISNYNINPCEHKGCKECILSYLADHDICFMCRQPFKSVTKIPEEEIEKLIKESKTTKTGDESEENKNEGEDKKEENKEEEKKEEGKIEEESKNEEKKVEEKKVEEKKEEDKEENKNQKKNEEDNEKEDNKNKE